MFLDVRIILIVNLLFYFYNYSITLSRKNKKWGYVEKKNDSSECILSSELMEKYFNGINWSKNTISYIYYIYLRFFFFFRYENMIISDYFSQW